MAKCGGTKKGGKKGKGGSYNGIYKQSFGKLHKTQF